MAEGAGVSIERRERVFYLAMALAITATVVTAFGHHAIVGISSFASPWWVHIHAVTCMGWVGLYLAQNVLVVRGAIAGHRRLGGVMAVWCVWMVAMGSAVLWMTLASHRGPPPIFTGPMLIVMDEITVLVFAMLVGAGLWLRARGDWHRRLMLSATITIIAPAFGRITEFTTGFSWSNIIVMQLIFWALRWALTSSSRTHSSSPRVGRGGHLGDGPDSSAAGGAASCRWLRRRYCRGAG